MRPGEIFLAQFPFGDVPGSETFQRMKLRPVLLLTGSLGPVPEVLVAYISSVIPTEKLASDIVARLRYSFQTGRTRFRSTGLKTESVLRLHKLATIHRASLVRNLGAINGATRALVAAKLKNLFKLD